MTPHPAPAPGDTPTPRTDALKRYSVSEGGINDDPGGDLIDIDDARALERENQSLRDALEAARSINWMAKKYAEAGGSRGPEMSDYLAAQEVITAALATGGTADAVKEGCSHKSTRLEHSASGNESQLVCNQCGEAITPME